MLLVTLILLSIFLMIRFSGVKARRQLKKARDAFWQKEHQANATRKIDITNLDYIKVPVETLPFMETQDESLIALQENVKKISREPILNLTGLSNTDLKLKYGVANINFLSGCDNNYTLLILDLANWGSYLFEHNYTQEAAAVLEFGIRCGSDISKNYTLLAAIYKARNDPGKINDLIQVAETLQTLTKDSIVFSLKEIQKSI